MVLAEITESELVDGDVNTEMRVTAFSENMARRRFKTTARIKGLDGAEVDEIELVEEGSTARQNVYAATVVAER